MGGEHEVCFHGHGSACNYIHKDNDYFKIITVSERDMKIWPEIKDFILQCLDKYGDTKKHRKCVVNWKSPKDIKFWWHNKDDDVTLDLMYDLTKLCVLAYPGKICFCLDRFKYYEEFPGQEWDMCTSEYAVINNYNFKLIEIPCNISKILLLSKEENSSSDWDTKEENSSSDWDTKYEKMKKYYKLLKKIQQLENDVINK